LTDFYLSHFINWSSGGNAALTDQPALPFNPFRLNIYEKRNYFWFIGFFVFFSGAVPPCPARSGMAGKTGVPDQGSLHSELLPAP